MEMPEKITVRLVGSDAPQVLVEFDGVGVNGESFANGYSDAGEIMFGIEAVLSPLGYSLDRKNLYQDMDLMVGDFHRATPDSEGEDARRREALHASIMHDVPMPDEYKEPPKR